VGKKRAESPPARVEMSLQPDTTIAEPHHDGAPTLGVEPVGVRKPTDDAEAVEETPGLEEAGKAPSRVGPEC
jgi:hypothetical protein